MVHDHRPTRPEDEKNSIRRQLRFNGDQGLGRALRLGRTYDVRYIDHNTDDKGSCSLIMNFF